MSPGTLLSSELASDRQGFQSGALVWAPDGGATADWAAAGAWPSVGDTQRTCGVHAARASVSAAAEPAAMLPRRTPGNLRDMAEHLVHIEPDRPLQLVVPARARIAVRPVPLEL